LPLENPSLDAAENINRAFSKQSSLYDYEDRSNPVIQDKRRQVYRHVEKYLGHEKKILELNAGTGLDAVHFASMGHMVHATDLSDGMVREIHSKILKQNFDGKLTCQQLSFDQLDQISRKKFDYIFSNFGGLNCIQDLSRVSRHLPHLLSPGGYVTWVIMPPVCPSELLWVFKGQAKKAFRRFGKKGTVAHLAGESFRTYYHSLGGIRKAMGPSFKLISCEGLAALSPQPHNKDFPLNHPLAYKALRKMDGVFRKFFPFDRCADHIIVTFQYNA
jgi:ubiquinone/menaquinone biosynthesis C-methylase UbiE